jgi:3-isopropylmalate/(R)-2-methylmalate dehydratase small subunit
MDAIKIIRAQAMPLNRADVDTDQIIPAKYLKLVQRSGFGRFLFDSWRKDESFILNDPVYANAHVLIAGPNFGCGSSREHAPWALEDFGYRAIIAPSFADIFRSNCTKIGLLPVVLPAADVDALIEAALAEPGVEATVDLERQVVVAPGGREIAFEIEPSVRHRLLNGLDDIGITLAHEDAIARYEAEREREGPVTTALT